MKVNLSNFTTGVCDRLRQVTFCAVLAGYLKDNTLEIFENKSIEGPFLIIDLFEIDGMNLKKLESMPSDDLIMCPHNSIINLETVKNFKPKFLNISDEAFLIEWNHIYRKIKPKSGAISNENLIKLDSIKKGTVGIHIRMTDRVTNWPSHGGITKSQYDNFKSIKIPFIIKYSNSKSLNVYLASDNLIGNNEIRKLLHGTVSLIEFKKCWKINGMRNTDGETFLLDLFGLAYSKIIFSTTGGGVPLTASLIGAIDDSNVHIWNRERIFDLFIIKLREFSKKIPYLFKIKKIIKKIIN